MPDSRFANGAAFVRDKFVPIAEATLPVTDWGFTRSDVVYDVVHVWENRFFRLDDHLDRFEASMAKRRIHPPQDRAAVAAILHRCVGLAGLTSAFVAMVATRGRPRVAGSAGGRLRQLSDRLCRAVDRRDPQGRAGARRSSLARRYAPRARCLRRPHGEELPVERFHLRPPRHP